MAAPEDRGAAIVFPMLSSGCSQSAEHQSAESPGD